MKLLQSSVLVLALLLVACEGAVSPTEPQLVEQEEAAFLPGDPGSGAEQPQGKVPQDEDDPE